MKPLLISMGEPAGIGPDVCLALAGHQAPLVVLGDKQVLKARAEQLGLLIQLQDYIPGSLPVVAKNQLTVLTLPGLGDVQPGVLNKAHAAYVVNLLDVAVQYCLSGEFSALVTAPVHKAILNQAGFAFTGHTEFLAAACGVNHVVMLLASDTMRMALVTTHLSLRDVPDAITSERLTRCIQILNAALKTSFGVDMPNIGVAGLNPHAGESGCLGHEEIEIITPALDALRGKGIKLRGPLPADTLFTPAGMQGCDALLAMYHDQGLSVLKYNSFGRAVNITLGLPVIRTSVDHGTALELAGTGRASAGSLLAAVSQAASMATHRENIHVDS
ncbi:MAG: 4-hydroxythreonine-4-phosphate dehydrogenase PdxA [Gammaproteobacteria bacterium]|nr:4-hydroxythreonine-4-phosphate dehydrogenase PdxA [Gammaproteobacteria bacterium]MCH9764315.1 4-hydroxythreonine-4-phosphate dehydrogenase PdxA [Gammaproteobacteria bacterium]